MIVFLSMGTDEAEVLEQGSIEMSDDEGSDREMHDDKTTGEICIEAVFGYEVLWDDGIWDGVTSHP
jgi:hypothetical protein